jgi:hypothetical protein
VKVYIDVLAPAAVERDMKVLNDHNNA